MRVLEEDIVIVGAGVVGLTSALTLQRLGRSVVVLDPSPPGSGASFGNAGTIADFAIAPVGSPALLKQLPSLLLDRQGPFSIRQGAMAALLPWLAQFAWQSLPAHCANNRWAIAALTLDAGARWQGLAADLEAGHLRQNKGCLYVFNNEARYQAGRRDMRLRQALGVNIELLNPGELAQLEPHLPQVEGGAFFPDALWFPIRAISLGSLLPGPKLMACKFFRSRSCGCPLKNAKWFCSWVMASG